MKFYKSPEYNEHDGSWWLTSDNEGPIDVVIKVEGDLASTVADAIVETLDVETKSRVKEQ